MGNIWVILQLLLEIVKLLRGTPGDKRVNILKRLRDAEKKACETGDTSDLETIRDDLAGR